MKEALIKVIAKDQTLSRNAPLTQERSERGGPGDREEDHRFCGREDLDRIDKGGRGDLPIPDTTNVIRRNNATRPDADSSKAVRGGSVAPRRKY